jgi:protein-S-isoprenylcysteine O-methyltransferase Ste14
VVLGEAIVSASWPLLAYLVGLGLAWHLFVTLYEEPALERAFGDEYRQYKRRVRRWIPDRPARSEDDPAS